MFATMGHVQRRQAYGAKLLRESFQEPRRRMADLCKRVLMNGGPRQRAVRPTLAIPSDRGEQRPQASIAAS